MQTSLQTDEPPPVAAEPGPWRPALCPLEEDQLYEVLEFRHAMMVECGLAPLLNENWHSLTHAHYREQFLLGQCLHFGAFVQGRLVATAGALVRTGWPYNTFQTPRAGWIMDVYVLSEYRNRGLARLVTRAAVDWLNAQGVGDIRLVASAQAKAQHLYEPLGFTASNEMRLVKP